MSNKRKVSLALIFAAIAGMLLHPNNTIITNLLAIVPCLVACIIIEPCIKREKE